jgi:H+/Cl- antiporter ClcA
MRELPELGVMDNPYDYFLGLSVMVNCIFGVLMIGIFMESPRKKIKTKNSEVSNLLIGIMLGFLSGVIGNFFVTSLFEVFRDVFPWWGSISIFLVSFFALIALIWKLNNKIYEALGD